MPKRVLLVDDNPNIIQGFKRIVHRSAAELEFQFVGSGAEALRIMVEQPFDVIVSDMRMPGMDGAELLQIVMKKFPQVVRIVLSGYSDPTMVLRSIRPVHLFLAKPCAAESVIATVSQTLAVLELLPDLHLKKWVVGISGLPVTSFIYDSLIRELKNSDGSLKKVGELMARDIGLVALSLKLVSSEFFGLPQRAMDIQQVFNRIGLETIKKIVLDKTNFFLVASATLPGNYSPEAINKHSLIVSKLAGEIAGRIEKNSSEMTAAAVVAGMLHDIGILVLSGSPGLYQIIVDCIASQQCSLCEAEYRILGATHAEVGACLLGLWGLPGPIVRAVANHHRLPREAADFSVETVIQLAETLAEGLTDEGKSLPSDEKLFKKFGLKQLDLERVIAH